MVSAEGFIQQVGIITQGYFKTEEVDKIVKFLMKDEPESLFIEDVAKFIVKKEI